jgi:hypothetical protein
MLTIEQICSLRNNRQYKETRSITYNWKYSATIVGSPNFCISDLKIDGKPWEHGNLILKIFIWMSKRFFISHEIGEFRNAVIERILDSSLRDDFDICILIKSNMKWVEAKSTKMEYIRKITEEFVTDSKIQLIIFNIINITEKNERKIFIDEFINKINCVFDNTIAELMKIDILHSRNDYILFLETHSQYLTKHLREKQFEGNLTGDINVFEIEETAND